MSTQHEIERLEAGIVTSQRLIDWLRANHDKIDALGLKVSTVCGWIDFDNPTREQALEVIKAFPGTWDKQQSSGSTPQAPLLDYAKYDNGVRIRLYAAPPPPSCRLVEEEYEVPAVPARKEKRMKLVCEQ